jgi:hypothetical protein
LAKIRKFSERFVILPRKKLKIHRVGRQNWLIRTANAVRWGWWWVATSSCVYTILRTALAVRIKPRVGMRIPNGMRDNMVVVDPPMAAAALPALP